MSADKPKILRDTDDNAREQAQELILTARFAALAVIDPETGYPNSSRVLVATDARGLPVILVSRLAGHTKGLLSSPRCSLLVGEPGKGDPLAWPRMSLQCDAEAIGDDDPGRGHLRSRFLRRHPKAALYADFPDFLYLRLTPVAASLNGGFGRAYALSRDDFAKHTGTPAMTPEDEETLVKRLESSSSVRDGFRIAAVTQRRAVLEMKDKQKILKISEI